MRKMYGGVSGARQHGVGAGRPQRKPVTWPVLGTGSLCPFDPFIERMTGALFARQGP